MSINEIAAELWQKAKRGPASQWIKIEGFKIQVTCRREVCKWGCHVRYIFSMNHESGSLLAVPYSLVRRLRKVFIPRGVIYPGENGDLFQYVQEVGVSGEIRQKLAALPLPDPSGQDYRASGDAECPVCGYAIRLHPLDPRELSYDKQPFLHVLCNGDRVKT